MSKVWRWLWLVTREGDRLHLVVSVRRVIRGSTAGIRAGNPLGR